jgi:leucyl aminopeptidase
MPTFSVSSANAAEVSADLVALPVFQGRRPGPGMEEVAAALGADLPALMKQHRFEGRLGETFNLPTLGGIRPRSVLLVGLGPEREAGTREIRLAAMRAGHLARGFDAVASTLPRVGSDAREAAHAFAEGVLLGAYRFDAYKAEPIDRGSQQPSRLRRVIVLSPSGSGDRRVVAEGLRRGRVYADAANWARDLVNTPAGDATPEFLADQARSMARRVGLTVRVRGRADLARGGFGGILGVGSGSATEPRLIELTHSGGGAGRPVAITGKGVTFDSGGLSLKEPAAMEWMKADMGGAASALAVMRAVAELELPLEVVAAIPSAENMPGGSAIRPGDVVRHRGRRTTEVLNTDAEGRLILADALAYLAEKEPAAIIDMATLTGAVMIALGDEVWGVMGTDRTLVGEILEASRLEGEPGWELPLYPEYRRHLESTVADVKNVGQRWGGALIAGLFLKEFVGRVPWAHLDIAGTAFAERPLEFWPRGATGSPARTVIRYLERRSSARPA